MLNYTSASDIVMNSARVNEGRFSYAFFYFFTGEKGIVKPKQID